MRQRMVFHGACVVLLMCHADPRLMALTNMQSNWFGRLRHRPFSTLRQAASAVPGLLSAPSVDCETTVSALAASSLCRAPVSAGGPLPSSDSVALDVADQSCSLKRSSLVRRG